MQTTAQNSNKKEQQYKRSLKKITNFIKNNFFSIITILATITFIIDPFSTWNYTYLDGDGYMRAIRIKNWIINPSFFEQPIMESNYPFGEILHWTRPLDIIWILCTLPFINLLEFKDAIFIGGAILSPILGIIGALSLGYGLKRHFNIFIAFLGIILFLNSPHIQSIYFFNKADHHSLITTLGILSTSIIMCWLKKRHNYYLIRLSLVLSIMSLCIIDGIIFSALVILFFIYLYVYKNISISYSYQIVKYYTIFSILLLMLNPPYQGFFHIDNGRFSILHITALLFSTVALRILLHYHIHTKRLKIISLFASFSSISLLTILIFGKSALITPLNSDLQAIFINRISQNQSISNTSFYYVVISYIIPLISLMINIYMLFKKNHQHYRLLILNLIIGLPIILLNTYYIRFESFAPIYSYIPFLCLIDYKYKNSKYYKTNTSDFPLSIYILILGFITLQICTLIPLSFFTTSKKINPYTPELLQSIKDINGTILTDTFLSPRYVYECDVNTVSTPYHRNTEGIIDAHNILYSTNDFDIMTLILKHQITQIVLFENYDNQYYNMQEENKHKLYYRLLKDERLPPFLEKIPTTDEKIHHYKITPL